METLQEIKDAVFKYMKVYDVKDDIGFTGKQRIEWKHSAFYVASGLRRIELVSDGNVIDVMTAVVGSGSEYDEMPVTMVDLDSVGADELLQMLKEYADSIAKVEGEWEALLRDAKKALKMQDLGKAGIEGILKSKLDGTGIEYSVESIEGENTKIGLENSFFETSFCLPSACPELPLAADSVADIARNAFVVPEDNLPEELLENIKSEMEKNNIVNWFTYNFNILSEEETQICIDTVAQGKQMDFQLNPNTREQLLEAITAAGIDAEMVESQYSYGTKDIKVSCGEFVIIITAGKIPGMLVACSPFFGVDYERTMNICVSHRPVQQVVQWLKLACSNLSPMANKVIPAYSALKEREQEISETSELLRSVKNMPGVSYSSNYYMSDMFDIDGGWKVYANISVKKPEPAKIARGAAEMVKMLIDLKSKVTTTE